MKKRWRPLLSLLLAVVMVVQLLPATALAAESSGDLGNGVSWSVSGGTLTISVDSSYTGTGAGEMPDLSYSWSYESGIQTDIPWYSVRDSITKIVIGSGVTRIGDHAFYLLGNATSVTFPEQGLRSIGEHAFSCCSSLTELRIPDSVQTIGESAFSVCSALQSVTLPSAITRIESGLFQSCEALETITLPDSVTYIGGAAFMYCSALKSISISANVTEIQNPFPYCTGMESFTIDENNPNYSSAGGCFIDKASKTIIQGFSSSDLTAIQAGTVEHIADNAFASMYGLTDVVIPDGVKDIGNWAFSLCVTTDGSKDGSATAGLRSVTIPGSVTDIGDGAFESNYLLESVTLNEGLKTIGSSAFFDCSKLQTISIPATTETIGCAAFWANNDDSGIEGGKGDSAGMTDAYIYAPDVVIYQDPGTLPTSAAIHGYTGSTAHVYAQMYNRTFIPFDDGCAHNWVEGEVTTAPTCTTAGAQTVTCSLCSTSYVKVLSALGHDWAMGHDDDEHWSDCTRCDAHIENESHIWGEGEVTTEPTCTGEGERTYTCAGCEATKTESIDALGHDWDEGTVTTPPTCTEEGEKAVTCQRCHESGTLPVEALGHEYDEEEWAHDEEDHWHPCDRCGGQAESAPHQWGDGEETTPPTFTTKGVMTWTCGICPATKTEDIPSLSEEGMLLMVIEDSNGVALPSGAYSDLTWLDAEEHVLVTGANSILLADVAQGYEISEETPVTCRVTFNDETMMAYTVPRTAEFTFTELGTCRSICLTPRKEVTVKGRLLPEQTALSGFRATLTVTLPSGDRTTALTPDANGCFSVNIPQFSAVVNVEAEGYKPLTVKDVQARTAAGSSTADLGTLALDKLAVNGTVLTAADLLDFRSMSYIPYYGYFELVGPDGQTYTNISASYETDNLGQTRIRLMLGADIRENLAAGDRVTLRYVNTYHSGNPFAMKPYTFVLRSVAESYEDSGIQPEFYVLGSLYAFAQRTAQIFLFDSDGRIVSRSEWFMQCYGEGDYTVVCFPKNTFVSTINGPDDLEIMGFPEQCYVKQTLHLEAGENLDLNLSIPHFLDLSDIGFSVEVGEAQRMGDLVPVYLSFRFSPELAELYPDAGLSIGITSLGRLVASGVLPLTQVNGKYATGIDCSVEERVTTYMGYEQLDLTLYGTSGTVCLYAPPEGQTLSICVKKTGLSGTFTATLPAESITVTEPEGVTSSPEGMLHLYAALSGSDYSANLYVDGEVACTLSRLITNGTGENLLPYELKQYGDGASVHTLYAEVLDRNGETVWSSEPYKVVLLSGDTPRATRLSIRMTNFNTDSTGTSETTTKDLDLLRGTWGTFPFRFYSEFNVGLDNTLINDVVFDYQLTMEHPELVKGDTVTLLVFCGKEQYQPTITSVNLNRNEVTGTYDGTFVLEGGTYTAQDLPYGYSLKYSADWSQEDWSTQQLEDRLAEHLRQQAAAENVYVPQRVDMETLEFKLQTMEDLPENVTDREEYLQDIREFAIAQNELADAYDQMIADTAGALTEIIGEDTAADLLTAETAEDLVSAINGLFGSMGAEVVPEDMTEQDLLGAGYRAVTAEGVTVYAMADAAGNYTSVVDLESGIRVSMGSAPTARARSARSGGEQSGRAALMEALSKINTVRSAIATLVEALIVYADKWLPYLDREAKIAQNKQAFEDWDWSLLLSPEEWKYYYQEVPKVRQKLIELLGSCQKAYTGVVNGVASRLPVGLVKGIGSVVKIIPGLGTLAGVLIDYNALLDTYEYALTKVESLEGEMALARKQQNQLWQALREPCLENHDAALDAYMECYRKVSELCSEAQDAIDDFGAHALSKSIALWTNAIPAIAGLIPGGQLVATAADVVLYTTGNLLDFTLVAAEWNQSNVDELWDDVTSSCVDVLTTEAFKLKEDCGDDDDDDDDNDDDDNDDNDDDDNKKKKPQYPLTPSYHIDPSGYIYEAVASNRIEGATATAYYKGEDGRPVLWTDADEVGEVNPQTTGSDGRYAWMTPIGGWLVKVTKEGYYDADSKNDPAAVDGWLPVPPPQLNVHIGMVSKASPQVNSALAASDRVRVVFSQYMDVAQLTSGGLVSVTQNGAAVPVSVSFDDAEVSPTQDGVYYGRVMTITRTDGGAFSGNNIVVTVDGAAKNYAGNTLSGGTYTSAPLSAAQIVGSLEHSYPNRFVTGVGKTETVAVLVKDTAGNPMAGVTVTAEQTVGGTLQVSASAVSDANGRAAFSVRGTASGYDTVTFTADTVSADLETRVSPIGTQAPKKPTANLNDYDVVTSGTRLILTAQQGATIYYTTNNTCPCTEGEGRMVYTGPITITESGFYRIAAYTAEGGYSERLNLHITVGEPTTDPTPDPGTGGYVPVTSAVTVEKAENGSVTVSPASAAAGATVTVTVKPDEGYALEALTVTGADGREVALTAQGGGKYTFTMPSSKVTVKAAFAKQQAGNDPFVDVTSGAYYYDAVLWAVENGITDGTSVTTFSPNANCTRGQIVTFLWRAAGCPEPESSANPFTDVMESAYYYKAMLWAVENGITDGTSATTFSPDDICTRDQAVTFLWRSAGKPAADTDNPFVDVKNGVWYTDAVLWAVDNAITDGTGKDTFSPGANCTRGQIVTFLYRWLVK